MPPALLLVAPCFVTVFKPVPITRHTSTADVPVQWQLTLHLCSTPAQLGCRHVAHT